VQVLVLCHAEHDPVGDRVVRELPGVLVGDPGRELLERGVGEATQRAHRAVVALEHRLHPLALQEHRVDVPGDDQVVADDDRVPALFRGPAPDPVLPGTVALAEHRVDEPVVRGKVVLGEEVHLESGLGHPREPRMVGGPGLLVVVAPQAVGDVVVREPFLGDRDMAVDELADGRLDLGKDLRLGEVFRAQ